MKSTDMASMTALAMSLGAIPISLLPERSSEHKIKMRILLQAFHYAARFCCAHLVQDIPGEEPNSRNDNGYGKKIGQALRSEFFGQAGLRQSGPEQKEENDVSKTLSRPVTAA